MPASGDGDAALVASLTRSRSIDGHSILCFFGFVQALEYTMSMKTCVIADLATLILLDAGWAGSTWCGYLTS
jgi:hypothetical protein